MTGGDDPFERDRMLAGIAVKAAELKTALRDANTALHDLRAERAKLRAVLAAATDVHEKVLAVMIERSAAEVLRATGEVMENVRRQMDGIVQRSQAVQTLGRVDRLLTYIQNELAGSGHSGGVDPPSGGVAGDTGSDRAAGRT